MRLGAYLSRDELAELCGCAPTSYAAMCRRLARMGWPHQARPGAPPLVLRSVHDAILTGAKPATTARRRPNFDALRGEQHDPTTRAA